MNVNRGGKTVLAALLIAVLSPVAVRADQDRMTRHERAIVAARTSSVPAISPASLPMSPRRNRRKDAIRVPVITICGVGELPEHTGRGLSHMVSIWDRWAVTDDAIRRRMKALFPEVRKHYAFFDDVLVPENCAPTPDAVRAILEFTGGLRTRDHLLVHCTRGISRSTAVAYAALCQHAGPGREAECLEKIRRIRPIAKPNSLIVRYADDILGRKGAMLLALRRKADGSVGNSIQPEPRSSLRAGRRSRLPSG